MGDRTLAKFEPMQLARLIALADNPEDQELLKELNEWGLAEYGQNKVWLSEYLSETRTGWYLTQLGEKVVSLALELRERMVSRG